MDTHAKQIDSLEADDRFYLRLTPCSITIKRWKSFLTLSQQETGSEGERGQETDIWKEGERKEDSEIEKL
jgi:hypothetical protein